MPRPTIGLETVREVDSALSERGHRPEVFDSFEAKVRVLLDELDGGDQDDQERRRVLDDLRGEGRAINPDRRR